MKQHLTFYTELDEFIIINISGIDAESFLHRQFTQDIFSLSNDSATISGYCQHNGKVITTNILWKEFNDKQNLININCLIKKDIAQLFIKRLELFKLKSKVKIHIDPKEPIGITISEENITYIEKKYSLELPKERLQISNNKLGTWIVAPSSINKRWWLIPKEYFYLEFIKNNKNIFKSNEFSFRDIWKYFDFINQIPFIGIQNSNLFLAHSLNLDLIGAISFNKGCYPGQEIIARMHYRKTIKYRMKLGSLNLIDKNNLSTNEIIGKDIFYINIENPCGRVIDYLYINNKLFLLLEIKTNYDTIHKDIYINNIKINLIA
ncbi:GcvT-like aminomethyltransferase [Candidatus Kinetoplastibacterium desouzaii TCC079E]|uniref:GcvT-like aminomethyltransferase n=1 Tax=Candidatus Kinetoplastidibacterium desouzai TCC079E TaxID=1208919 RepID=M1LME2_9PROT|nr:folate-binding protein YgfZ [Candidatus Kinetoplastibacterium desouzaii]AGF46892.1 GcvT-like aminomethyltransferase [Candidatus Kinetoplastibacterium desouzaii TCC079E]